MTVAADFELRIVDSDDVSILFDLNDPTGLNNPHGVQTNFGLDGVFTLVPPGMEFTRFSPPAADGARTVGSRARLGAVSWPQRIVAADADALFEAVGELSQMLRKGGSIWYRPKGVERPRWIDFEPSDAPGLFNGRPQDLSLIVNEFDTTDGVVIQLTRAPTLRRAILDSNTNILSNPTMLRAAARTGVSPLAWDWNTPGGISDEEISATEEAYLVTIATASERNFRQTVVVGGPGDVYAGSFYAKVISGTTARVRAVVLAQNGGTTVDTALGPQVVLGSQWTRLSVVSPPASAGVDRFRLQIRFENLGAAASRVALRNAQLEADEVTPFVPSVQSMATDGLLTMPIWVEGNAWAPVSLNLQTNDADARIQEFVVGRRSSHGEGRARQTVAYLFGNTVQLEDGTLTGDTASAVDADALGGNVAETSYTTAPTVMAKRIRTALAIPPSDMRGAWDVYVRVKATDEGRHVLQLRWAVGDITPAPNTNAEVVHDTNTIAVYGYVMKYLGRVYVPVDVAVLDGAMALELWSRLENGGGALRWDALMIVPVDDPDPCTSRIIAAPRSEEEWLGSELASPPAEIGLDPTWVAGDVKGSTYRLHGDLHAAGTPPNGGLVWGVGRHVVTFYFDGTNTPELTFKARVANITDDTTEVEVPAGLTGIVYDGDTVIPTTTLEFDGTAAKAYQAQVLVPAWDEGSARITSIKHEVVPYLALDDAVLSDPETGVVARINGDGEFLNLLDVAGPVPMWCPPGLSVIYAQAIDVRLLNYSEGESVLDRTWRLGISYAPRDWA